MKQYIIINKDLEMSPGKIAGQAAHASVGFTYSYGDEDLAVFDWFNYHAQRKIVVGLTEEKIRNAMFKLTEEKIPFYVVRDTGKTEVEANSLTAIAIRPMSNENTPKWFARWRLL